MRSALLCQTQVDDTFRRRADLTIDGDSEPLVNEFRFIEDLTTGTS